MRARARAGSAGDAPPRCDGWMLTATLTLCRAEWSLAEHSTLPTTPFPALRTRTATRDLHYGMIGDTAPVNVNVHANVNVERRQRFIAVLSSRACQTCQLHSHMQNGHGDTNQAVTKETYSLSLGLRLRVPEDLSGGWHGSRTRTSCKASYGADEDEGRGRVH
jgi:hypothetical protein